MSKLKKNEKLILFLQKIVFLHVILFLLRNVYFFIEKFVRKDKRLLLFFFTEEYYYDNSRYFFEFMREKEDFRSILFVSHKKIFNELRVVFPGEVIYAQSIIGFGLFLRSKNVVISYGTSAAVFAPYYLHEKCKNIIYLGHGIPMKKMGLETPVWRKYGKKFQLQKYSYMVACSEIEQPMHSKGFDVKTDHIWITGLPRNDHLLKPPGKNPDLLLKNPYLNCKIILYAPTWREYGYQTIFFPFKDFDAQKIDGFLEMNDAYILIRGHKEDIKRKSLVKDLDISQMKRVISAEQDTFPDVYQILPYVDILITDYSSIVLDFLLLNRPVCFIPYDLKEYSSYIGFFLDYNSNTPGSKISTQEQFLSEIQKYINHPETHGEWRKKVCDMYHKYQDGKSCERIYKQIQNFSRFLENTR